MCIPNFKQDRRNFAKKKNVLPFTPPESRTFSYLKPRKAAQVYYSGSICASDYSRIKCTYDIDQFQKC